MNTWYTFDKYIQNNKTFDTMAFYNPTLLSENEEQRVNPEPNDSLFDSQFLSQSQISILGPKPIPSEYINKTDQTPLDQPFIEWYTTRIQLEKYVSPSWIALSSTPYIQEPTQTLATEAPLLSDTKVENKDDLKKELEQILDNLNFEIEENNIVIRRELARWFEKNGEHGINVVWDLPEKKIIIGR